MDTDTVYVIHVNVFPRPKIFIEQKALDTIAFLCDGDARTGLNSLQLAVQAQVSLARPNQLDGSQEILVKEEHIKEGLQRSHILYDKAGKRRCTYFFKCYDFYCEAQSFERCPAALHGAFHSPVTSKPDSDSEIFIGLVLSTVK